MSVAEKIRTSFQLNRKQISADTITPVSLYLKLRDQYPGALLLECSDYQDRSDSVSIIALDPLYSIRVQDYLLQIYEGSNLLEQQAIWERSLVDQVQDFSNSLSIDSNSPYLGLYGHFNFESARYFDQIEFDSSKTQQAEEAIPDIHLSLFRFILVFDHYRERLEILELQEEGGNSALNFLMQNIRKSLPPRYPFKLDGKEKASCTDADFLAMVESGKRHCQQGDVFQVVLSRAFSQSFQGDEFEVYRALRSLNPSPYLFFLDFGSYRILGSSPEPHLQIRDSRATMKPIAGTVKRTGIAEQDKIAIEALQNDPKENSEHVMLVDLARNDLARSSSKVSVRDYAQLQRFSHVFHLVSTVEAELDQSKSALEVFGNTFPAGTLSGAPKIKAMELIDYYENQARGFYGGAVGMLGINGELNLAITIRSILSQDQHLHFQAGAGVVVASDPQSELKEVDNKLGALRKALELAQQSA
jgi:anthranilate synthase component 1